MPRGPDPASVERFRLSIDGLVEPDEPLGLAVSGGPDSLALLLLAHAVRPDDILVATVNHQLRKEGAAEARQVADTCAALGVPHAILTARWAEKPTANLQARARAKRLELLVDWARDRRIPAIATGHHADDQAETLLMRLARGAGLAGLAGVRRTRALAPDLRIVRPLLDWNRDELAQTAEQSGLAPVIDPTNDDPAHDRTRIRQAIAAANIGDVANIARSAAHLADAEDALQWTIGGLAKERIRSRGETGLSLDTRGLPFELSRRLLLLAFERLGRPLPDGPATVRLIGALRDGKVATLGGLRFEGREEWLVTPAAPRRSEGSPGAK